jgi:menaquinone-dependent protoporphyrinogen oxidase
VVVPLGARARAREREAMTRVLVAFASKHGATAEIAAAVAEALRAAGLQTDCHEAAAVASLEPYDAVVLGSAVYMKRWRREARRFLRRHGDALAQRPFWVFSSGPVGDPANDDAAWLEPASTIALAESLGARGHMVFGGCVPAEPEGFMQRSMAKNTPPAYRDRRNWGEIRAWAATIAAQIAVPA